MLDNYIAVLGDSKKKKKNCCNSYQTQQNKIEFRSVMLKIELLEYDFRVRKSGRQDILS